MPRGRDCTRRRDFTRDRGAAHATHHMALIAKLSSRWSAHRDLQEQSHTIRAQAVV